MSYTVLGIQYGGHDTSAAIMRNGVLLGACEEERYNLKKHTREFPRQSIADCLGKAAVGMAQVDEIAVAFDPVFYIRETYLKTALNDDYRIGALINDIDRIKTHYEFEATIRKETGFEGKISFYKHHLCHLASAYYPSGFQEALLVSHDGIGEIEASMIARGSNGRIEVLHAENRYPDSLGLLYSAVTHHLGFKHHCDEGIIMGLACYGNPNARIPGRQDTYLSAFEDILKVDGPYSYKVNRDWISYHKVRDVWVSDRFVEWFGPKVAWTDDPSQHHRDMAAALQRRLEDVVIAQLKRAREEFGLRKAAFAGGVALNCSMNGKVAASRIFDEIFVQPASGDAGTSAGACYLAHREHDKSYQPKTAHNFYLGYSAGDEEIEAAFKEAGLQYSRPKNLMEITAKRLAEGKIIAWHQGGAEFGPRALGHRSILTRPYPAEMKDYLNRQVKFREPFRPFAPAVMEEHTSEYFDIPQKSPHMLIACQALPATREKIAATVHVDNSCRVQTVNSELNPEFYALLKAFKAETGCPVILNTSFNVKGQPIINTPRQAIACFQSTKIDVLVVGSYICEKPGAQGMKP